MYLRKIRGIDNKDTGMRVPEKGIPHIFDRLYQVDKSRSGQSRGAGLGLHICQQIVEVHGGSIEFRNNEEKVLPVSDLTTS